MCVGLCVCVCVFDGSGPGEIQEIRQRLEIA